MSPSMSPSPTPPETDSTADSAAGASPSTAVPPAPRRRSGRARLAFFVASLLVVTSLVGAPWLADAVGGEGEEESLYKYLSTFTEVLSLVRQAYVDQADLGVLMEGALDGSTGALDPFSLYVPAEAVEGYMAARRTGKRLSGLTLLRERGIAYVVSVDPGSPAAEAGVQAGDVVTRVNDASTREEPLWAVQQMLAAGAGEPVAMELLRSGETVAVDFELTPYEVPVASLERLERDGTTAAVLTIGSFDNTTATRVEELLGDSREGETSRLLLDLRNAAGGDSEAAYAVAALLADGDLGWLMKRDTELEAFHGGESRGWDGRLVVMVNRGTLGAAEVLATVLRQRLDAELVGENTFGFAGRQDFAELSNGGRLLYTDAFYTGPDGEILNESLEPDHRVDFFSRDYEEREMPAYELIYERSLDVLFDGEGEALAEAA